MVAELSLLHPKYLPTEIKKAPELKRLKLKHRRILALHLQGYTAQKVAETLGCSRELVYNTINSSLGQAFLERAYEAVDQEIKALVPIAVNAVRRNMACGDPSVEVRAASEAFKLNKKYDSAEGESTIEDVIERVMEKFNTDGSRLRVSEKQIVKRIVGVGNEGA